MPLTPFYHGCQQQDTSSGKITLQQFQYLFIRVLYHLTTRGIRISHPCSSVKQTQKVINLGGRTDCRTRIFIRGLLFY